MLSAIKYVVNLLRSNTWYSDRLLQPTIFITSSACVRKNERLVSKRKKFARVLRTIRTTDSGLFGEIKSLDFNNWNKSAETAAGKGDLEEKQMSSFDSFTLRHYLEQKEIVKKKISTAVNIFTYFDEQYLTMSSNGKIFSRFQLWRVGLRMSFHIWKVAFENYIIFSI